MAIRQSETELEACVMMEWEYLASLLSAFYFCEMGFGSLSENSTDLNWKLGINKE